jgi:hypothetical protein
VENERVERERRREDGEVLVGEAGCLADIEGKASDRVKTE